MKIFFTGGGTAGHVFPIIAVVREMKKIYPENDLKLFYVGPKDAYALKLLGKEGVKVKTIITGKYRRYFSLKNVIDFFKIPIGFFQALFFVFIYAPDLVFSKGGYGSFPVVVASRCLFVPIFLHESDATPGLASKLESKVAKEIFTSFEETDYFPVKKRVCVGNPVREEILGGSLEKAKQIFQLEGERPLIFIMGGSQGSEPINNLILEILPELLADFEIVHQAGRRNYKSVKAEAEVLMNEETSHYYHLLPFLNELELKHILAAADLVISRAGSGSLFEIASVAKPSILVPLPDSAQNHQFKNAYEFAEYGGGEVLEQQNLKPHFFLERLKYFFDRPEVLKLMARNAKKFARPKSASIIANYILEYLYQTLN